VSAGLNDIPMRVLMTTDAVGGVWRYSLDLAAELASRRVETVLAVLGPEPSEEQCCEAAGIGLSLIVTGLPLDWLAKAPSDLAATGRSIARLAEEVGADLVHLNSPAAAADADFAIPVVAVCHSCVATWWAAVKHGRLPADFRWRTDLLRAGLGAADLLIAPTHAFADAVRQTYALPSHPTVVHNGRKPPAAADLQGPVAGIFVFTAGRLWDEGKNVAVLDRAAERLSIKAFAAGPLAGPNGTQSVLRRLSPLGSLSAGAVRSWLAREPIFVSVSLYEPFGLGVLEAAQAGCPLVLSDIPTFRELWDGAAVFVDPNDESALAAAITRLAEDTNHRCQMSVAAQSRADCYGLDAMATRMLAIYRSVVPAAPDVRRAVA
jgi:glycosyltransferase involved in cell wall biosynthesis